MLNNALVDAGGSVKAVQQTWPATASAETFPEHAKTHISDGALCKALHHELGKLDVGYLDGLC